MVPISILSLFSLWATSALALNISANGLVTHDTQSFLLELDNSTQIATRLLAKASATGAQQDFNYLLPVQGRESDGFLALGDLQLRLRPQGAGRDRWQDVSTHVNRTEVKNSNRTEVRSSNSTSRRKLTTSDITPALAASLPDGAQRLPISVARTWLADSEYLELSFNITNTGDNALELGAIGMPTPWNNNWAGLEQEPTWTQHVVTDPAPGLDAGYTITNRLTGETPTLLTIPAGSSSPLEAYRLNYPTQEGDSRWPAAYLDKQNTDFSAEGVFTWWTATKGIAEIDEADAKANDFQRGRPWNTPSNVILRSGQSRTVGLRFAIAKGPRQVEDRLRELGRPVIVGVPGFVVARNEPAKMIVHSKHRPSVRGVEPKALACKDAVKTSDETWSIDVKANNDAFGEARVTLDLGNGTTGTAHYSIIKPHTQQLDGLGAFRFREQYYERDDDYFKRAPGIISYDHSTKQQVTDDTRSWVAGLSDEGGSGAYVSAAAKQYGRPNAVEIEKLEMFATETLWGQLQDPDPKSDRYAGVRKSLFYYDENLLDDPQAGYDPAINRSLAWNQTEAEKLERSYNYPHAVVVYWTLYRLARNYKGLVTQRGWKWYLNRCVDTILAMQKHAGTDKFSQFGLMEGTYFLRVLEDLYREGLSEQADQVETFMRARADIWKGEKYPYASEFPWDNTGQEEVYEWSRYFNNSATANATIETLMAIMPSVPHWGYSGAGRDLWDCLYACKRGPGARLERVLHHYKGSQSSLALMDHFLINPQDIKLLRAGYGGIIGPLASILEDGFGSSAYHTRQDYLNWDPLSGDSGVNIALYTLNARTVYVNEPELGGHAAFGGQVDQQDNNVVIKVMDGIQQRVFLAPIALYIELDAGKVHSVEYNTHSHKVEVVLAAADAHTPTARLRWRTTVDKQSSYALQEKYAVERGAHVIPLSKDSHTRVTLLQG
ncbi:unnamed protein product [Sympodiomycopsis kandeliae]